MKKLLPPALRVCFTGRTKREEVVQLIAKRSVTLEVAGR